MSTHSRLPPSVLPAKAGIQVLRDRHFLTAVDAGLRRHDDKEDV
ncbi:MAG: hypothetical protein HW419_1995 [Deltaproteobacteria bacterium]|nr:hypothetical protein [Deltaproteobacteria bacterium]